MIERPQGIKNQMAQRGRQDQAAPVLTILEPKDGTKITDSMVKLKLGLGGDLKSYHPHKDSASKACNPIHVIQDNQPYEAHYSLETGSELRNLAAGNRSSGKHSIKLELVDKMGSVVDNSGYHSTTREISVVK